MAGMSKILGPKRDFCGWQRENAKLQIQEDKAKKKSYEDDINAHDREQKAKFDDLMKSGLYAIDSTVPSSPTYGQLVPIDPGLNGHTSVEQVVAENTRLKAAIANKDAYIRRLGDCLDELEWAVKEEGGMQPVYKDGVMSLIKIEDKPKAGVK